MRTPIAVALAWPARMTTPVPRLDLVKTRQCAHLRSSGRGRVFRLCGLRARRSSAEAAHLPYSTPPTKSPLRPFLERKIGFLDIAATVAYCLERAEARGLFNRIHSLDDVLAVDHEARLMARSRLTRYTGVTDGPHGEFVCKHPLPNRIGATMIEALLGHGSRATRCSCSRSCSC